MDGGQQGPRHAALVQPRNSHTEQNGVLAHVVIAAPAGALQLRSGRFLCTCPDGKLDQLERTPPASYGKACKPSSIARPPVQRLVCRYLPVLPTAVVGKLPMVAVAPRELETPTGRPSNLALAVLQPDPEKLKGSRWQ